MNSVLAILLFILCAFDAWLTQKRIRQYGVQVELNRSIRWLSSLIGPELGSVLGVMIPSVSLIGLSLQFHLQWVLALLLGFRLRQFFVQCESLVFEKQIKDFASTLTDAASSGPRGNPSPVAPPDLNPGVEPKTDPIHLPGENNE